jgi:hypothetical protein
MAVTIEMDYGLDALFSIPIRGKKIFSTPQHPYRL